MVAQAHLNMQKVDYIGLCTEHRDFYVKIGGNWCMDTLWHSAVQCDNGAKWLVTVSTNG